MRKFSNPLILTAQKNHPLSNLPLSLLVSHRSIADSVEQAADISAERRRIHREVRHMVDTGRIQEEE